MSNRVELVTNAPNFIRGNDPNTGKERWRLGGSSNINTRDLGRRALHP